MYFVFLFHFAFDIQDISNAEREMMARVSNCISLLGRHFVQITESMIIQMIEASLTHPVVDLLLPEIGEQVLDLAKRNLEAAMMQ